MAYGEPTAASYGRGTDGSPYGKASPDFYGKDADKPKIIKDKPQKATSNNLPKFNLLVAHYPTDSDAEKVKQDIGGEVNSPYIQNTCVVRISKAFNYAGDPEDEIPKRDGLYTVNGADHKNYALRVEEFIHYLRDEFGAPDVVKSGANISVTPFQNKKGIIAWHVSGWSDATGHFTLWDGKDGLYVGGHDYWGFPTSKPDTGPWLTKVEFWETQGE